MNLTIDNISEDLEGFGDCGTGYRYITKSVQFTLVELKNELKKQFSLPLNKPFWYCEIDLTNWNYELHNYPVYSNETDFPVMRRSYSITVSKNVFWKKVEQIITQFKLQEGHVLIKPNTRYAQKDVDTLSFDVEFFSYTRTLDTKEIQNWEELMLQSLTSISI